MTTIIYANWEDQEILTDLDRDSWIKVQTESYYGDSDALDEFLNDLVADVRNPLVFLLDLNENGKQEIMKKFKEHCKELATEEFNETHEEFEIGI